VGAHVHAEDEPAVDQPVETHDRVDREARTEAIAAAVVYESPDRVDAETGEGDQLEDVERVEDLHTDEAHLEIARMAGPAETTTEGPGVVDPPAASDPSDYPMSGQHIASEGARVAEIDEEGRLVLISRRGRGRRGHRRQGQTQGRERS